MKRKTLDLISVPKSFSLNVIDKGDSNLRNEQLHFKVKKSLKKKFRELAVLHKMKDIDFFHFLFDSYLYQKGLKNDFCENDENNFSENFENIKQKLTSEFPDENQEVISILRSKLEEI